MAKSQRKRKHAKFEAVLVYYDEPQLMRLKISDDHFLIAAAIADDLGSYPFFAAEISYDQYERYRRGSTHLRYLFDYPRYKKWYTFDFASLDEDDLVYAYEVQKDEINPEWLPSAGFFSRSHTEPDPTANQQLSQETFLIDGSWNLPDFSQFYGRVSDVYSFFLALDKFFRAAVPVDIKRAIKTAFTHYPLQGGSSYKHFYLDLITSQRYADRLSVKSIAYASPGRVEIFARNDIFSNFETSIRIFAENEQEVTERYNMLHSYLSKSNY
jgi:hypothetical protein